MRTSFVITTTVPPGVTLSVAKGYIRDALGSWGGSFHPDDDLFKGLPCTVRTLGDQASIAERAAKVADQVAADHRACAQRYKGGLENGADDRAQLERFVALHTTEASVAEYIAKEIRNRLGATT